jgi:ribosomal protein L16 Arg81 hydroxylase
MTISDAPSCSVTYDRHYDDRNSFIIQATGSAMNKTRVKVTGSDEQEPDREWH